MNAGMTTARICGLKGKAYYNRSRGIYMWNVTFEGAATLIQKYWILSAGETEEEAKEYQKEITKKLGELQIFNGNEVAILFNSEGKVFAIASLGQDEWISIEKRKIVKKSFGDYEITSLKVY